jgi:hypothetical protein
MRRQVAFLVKVLRSGLAVGLLLSASLAAMASDSAQPPAGTKTAQPVIELARGGQCVEDPATMRRNHMKFLKHQRDDTMRSGIRSAKYSLKACVECHASQKTGSVNVSDTNFCQSCHSYAAVQIDCFECHANKPLVKP